MKNTSLFLALILSLMASGCTTEHPPEIVPENGPYIQVFVIADEMELKGFKDLNFDVVWIEFNGKDICMVGYAEQEQYRALAERYNDLDYHFMPFYGTPDVLSEKMYSIDVTCTQEFDAEHPAGQSLGDIVSLCASSLYDFIQNGYLKPDHTPQIPIGWEKMIAKSTQDYIPFVAPLNELGGYETRLLYPECRLIFTRKPATPGTYTFTVTARVGDQVISRQIDYKFE